MTELEAAIRGWIELTEVVEAPRWVRAKEPEKMNFSTLGGEMDGPPVELASASNKPWSSFKASDYTDEQWKRACLIHLEGSDENPKSYCKLPVREPSGTLNRNAMAAAAAALAGARGGLSAPVAEKKKAARALLALYKQIGEDPPESLSKMNFSALDDLPDNLREYMELERELSGDEWLLAAVTREESGYLREDLSANTAVEFVSSSAYPPLDRSPKKNWVDQVGGLPDFIERIAKHVHYEAGRPIGMAIAIAVSTVKKWCAGGEVHQFPGIQVLGAKARAQACKAVAEWEAKKARSKAKSAAS